MATFVAPPAESPTDLPPAAPSASLRPDALQVIRRNGTFSPFDAGKIGTAVNKAFIAVEGSGAAASQRIHDIVGTLTRSIVETLGRRNAAGRPLHIEDIQDQVELALMRAGEHKVARAYILYREERTDERRRREEAQAPTPPRLQVKLLDGRTEPLDEARLQREITVACLGLDGVSAADVLAEVRRNLYDGITTRELALAQTMAARTLVEQDPSYAYVSARLLLNSLREEALAFVMPEVAANPAQAHTLDYAAYFPAFVHKGAELEILDRELKAFDLPRLAAALRPERDQLFQFLGLQTLYDRYFLHHGGGAL